MATGENRHEEDKAEKPGRPFSVTLLALGVLTLGGLNLVRFIQSILHWGFLSRLLPFSPLYVALSGLIWAIAGFALAWGLWRGRIWAPQASRWATLVYLLYTWLNRLLYANPASRNTDLPFIAVLNLLLVAFIFWVLSRRKAKDFFGDRYER